MQRLLYARRVRMPNFTSVSNISKFHFFSRVPIFFSISLRIQHFQRAEFRSNFKISFLYSTSLTAWGLWCQAKDRLIA